MGSGGPSGGRLAKASQSIVFSHVAQNFTRRVDLDRLPANLPVINQCHEFCAAAAWRYAFDRDTDHTIGVQQGPIQQRNYTYGQATKATR